VLAVDIPGNRLLVDHERTGLLYRTESGLADMVLRLRDDPALRERLGQSAARSMLENYQPHQEAERYWALYRDVLEHRT
jgi:glycosyltransferase involved in cell wall biosynthesis